MNTKEVVMRTTLLALAALVAAAAALPASAAQPQSVHISSYLYGQPDPADPTNPNLFAISGCFTISGAITDEGGAPIFDGAGNIVRCDNPTGISGLVRFDGLGHFVTGSPNVLQATHTLVGRHGTIEIKFEGKYGPFQLVGGRIVTETLVGGAWQITGGTGDYAGLQGTGTSSAVADFTDTFSTGGPVTVVHIEDGDVHWTG